MEADSLQMLRVFHSGGDIHYVLPHFQREYAWGEKEWSTLLNDVFGVYEIYNDTQPPEHFMGSLVVINDGTRAGTVPVFRLVDGQQRLTTVSLLLCALGRLLENDETYSQVCRKVQKMLLNLDERGDLHYKLLPTLKYGDRASYCAIVTGREPPPNVQSRVPEAFAYLSAQLATRLEANGINPERLFNVLMTSLQVVFINLSQTERPYEIFESLNFKGKPLTQADLVRNYIAMKLPAERQEPVFTELWSPIEETLLEKHEVGRSGLGELTAFLRHYFAYLYGVLVNEDHVYSRFRDRGQAQTVEEFERELKRIRRFAGYYACLLRPQQERDADVRRQLERLNTLEGSTTYPFLLYMYDEWQQGTISRQEFLDGLRCLETYLVRRFLNRSGTNYNRMFPVLIKEMNTADFVPALRKALGARDEPSDAQLRYTAATASLYQNNPGSRQKLALVFDTINRHLSVGSGAYTVLSGDPTIEHILPQSLSAAWREDLGESWSEDHALQHTLGNLTLLTSEWNSELSNDIYAVKRPRLSENGLRLNSEYFTHHAPDKWNAEAIRGRAEWLMNKATQIWPRLGEGNGSAERLPKAVVIAGRTYSVDNWRSVVRRTAEAAAALCGDDFAQRVVRKWPTYFSQQPTGDGWFQLANGWSVYVNNPAATNKRLHAAIVAGMGLPEGEHALVYW